MIAFPLLLLIVPAIVKAAPRKAAVYYSDGKVLTGNISLTRGRKFKLNIPKGGKLKTSDMITGEDVRYGKVRQFTFEPVREIRFHAEREEIRQNWKFVETTKYDEKTAIADFSPAKKEFWGETYPLRYLAAEVIFSSGETIAGHLYSAVLYLETQEKTSRIILRSKQRGDKGTRMDDLVYVTKIKMLDEGKEIAANVAVKFTNMTFEPNDVVQAVTRDSLTPVPTERGDEPGTFLVKSTFGEDFYLAVKKGRNCYVGWPPTRDRRLFALAESHLKRQRDFYNDKTDARESSAQIRADEFRLDRWRVGQGVGDDRRALEIEHLAMEVRSGQSGHAPFFAGDVLSPYLSAGASHAGSGNLRRTLADATRKRHCLRWQIDC
ncbi:MAG: hypothetical protein ACYS0H_01545 [Planctomycetota bacterium]|jgi:hypothetical protein